MSTKLIQVNTKGDPWYFRIPGDWDRTTFVHFMRKRAMEHARLHGYTEDVMTWDDALKTVHMGPEVEFILEPPIALTFSVNPEQNLLPPNRMGL